MSFVCSLIHVFSTRASFRRRQTIRIYRNLPPQLLNDNGHKLNAEVEGVSTLVLHHPFRLSR